MMVREARKPLKSIPKFRLTRASFPGRRVWSVFSTPPWKDLSWELAGPNTQEDSRPRHKWLWSPIGLESHGKQPPLCSLKKCTIGSMTF